MAKVLQPKVGGGAWLVRGKWQNHIYISSIQRWKATGRGKSFSVWSPKSELPNYVYIYKYKSESGQSILFHQPRFLWNKGIDYLSQLPVGGPENSCEVAMIWPTECLSMKKLCISTLDSLLLYPTKTCKKLIQKGTVSNKFKFKQFKHQNLQHRVYFYQLDFFHMSCTQSNHQSYPGNLHMFDPNPVEYSIWSKIKPRRYINLGQAARYSGKKRWFCNGFAGWIDKYQVNLGRLTWIWPSAAYPSSVHYLTTPTRNSRAY